MELFPLDAKLNGLAFVSARDRNLNLPGQMKIGAIQNRFRLGKKMVLALSRQSLELDAMATILV